MEKVSVIRGAGAALLQPNIDTEVIISVERVMTFNRGKLGPYCLEPLRFRSDGSENPDFVLNQPRYRAATVLIAGENFGCGSSREAAVWSLFDRGIRCIISPSFGDIFYTNCLQNGLLPIVMPIEEVQRLAAELVRSADPAMTVDLVAQRITSASGRAVPFDFDAGKRAALLGGVDEVSETLKLAPAIAAFQAADRALHPWIYAGVARRSARVLLLAGDDIGSAIMGKVRRVIEWFISRRGLDLELQEDRAWGAIRAADAILFGAADSGRDGGIPPGIRKELGLFANLHAIGTDLLIVRGLADDAHTPSTRAETECIARVAFEMARVRRGRVCSVDQASVRHAVMRWRDLVQAVRDAEYPDVDLRHMHVEVATTQLVSAPGQFDVLLTENLFGDVVSICADMIGGSIGMFPAASLGIAAADGRRRGLYQPMHGSSPDHAKGVANPIGAILSFGLSLQYSIGVPQEARLLRQAVDAAVASGGLPAMSTASLTDAVLAALDRLVQCGGGA